MTDTERTMQEIESKGYVKPGKACGDWSYFYKNLDGLSWGTYVLTLENESITFKAKNDAAALRYVYDTFTPETEYELAEVITEYRHVSMNYNS